MKLESFRQMLEKISNIKFHQNPTIGSRVVSCGQKDMTKLIVAFRNFANAPENANPYYTARGYILNFLRFRKETNTKQHIHFRFHYGFES